MLQGAHPSGTASSTGLGFRFVNATNPRTMNVRGLTAVTRNLHSLKRDLLLFDSVSVMGLDLDALERDDPALAASCWYLIEKGALSVVPSRREDLWIDSRYRRATDAQHDNMLIPPRWSIMGHEYKFEEGDTPLALLLSTAGHPAGRIGAYDELPVGGEIIVALIEQLATNQRTVPLLRAMPTTADWRDIEGTFALPSTLTGSIEADLVQVVINAFPVPTDDVPFEDVLAFSREHETQRRLTSLRLWMESRIVAGVSIASASLDLETALHEFSQYMKIQKMKSKTSTIRTVFSIPLGIIEEIAHLRPRGALEVVLTTADRKAQRLESELAAPGHQLAILYEAQDRFG